MSRIVRKDSDCADCLCRVCARNVNNDSYNPLEEYPNCSCDNCTPGVSTVIETTDDCSQFLPDIEDENSLEVMKMTEVEYDAIKLSLNKMRYLEIITADEFDKYSEKAHSIYLSLMEATG